MRMHSLSVKEDPTGFLNLFRLASMDRFGDPSGHIQGRGRWHHGSKKGPGRFNDRITKAQSKLRSNADTRNPFAVLAKVIRDRHGEYVVRRVEQLPVRMKVPRLRRCVR